jgi:histidinol-phosphate aminotransferase
VLDTTMRAFARPGDRIAYSVPTFSMIPAFARINGLVPVEQPLRDAANGYDIDGERLVASNARIIYVCVPNNPTGTDVGRTSLEYVVDHAPGIVIVDEAYAEFAPSTHEDLLKHGGNVVLTRTLSKAFGLAGLRIGYGLGAPDVIDYIERARGPYKVNAAAERAALAALEETPDGLEWVRDRARLARESRDRFLVALRERGFEPLPSATNFVLVPHRDAPAIASRLRRDGFIVRLMTELPRDLSALAASSGRALRIGVGPWGVMERVLTSLSGARG